MNCSRKFRMDKSAKEALSLLLILTVICLTTAKQGFLLTAPAQLQTGRAERMCISFHGFTQTEGEEFIVETSLIRAPHGSQREILHTENIRINGYHDCFDFVVPATLPIDISEVDLLVRGRSRMTEYVFEQQKPVRVRRPELTTFIQTDKPKYKPGTQVKFRVLSVDENLIPVLTPIHRIEITSPTDIKIMVWQNTTVTETKGIADLALALSDEPTLGTYNIKVTVNIDDEPTVAQFSVEEYVLPKYEIKVKTKSYLSVIDEKVEGEICAMYTYGEPVRGNLNTRVCIKIESYGWYKQEQRPCVYINNTEIVGCQAFSVLTEELQLTNASYSIYNAHLEVFAEVTETATGVILNTTRSDVEVTSEIFKLEFLESSPQYYKPGLPYYGRVDAKFPDGTPAAGETVSIEFHEYTHNKHFTKLSTTDSRGQVLFSLPPLDVEIKSLSVQARMPEYNVEYIRGRHSPQEIMANIALKQWYSPTNSYVQVQPIEGAVECDSDLMLNISHTVEEQGFIDLHYQVITKGNIVEQGVVRNTFNKGSLAQPDQGFEEMVCEEGKIYSTCAPPPVSCAQANELVAMWRRWDHPCITGCYCPWPRNILHEGRCISPSMCPGYRGNVTVPDCPPDQIYSDCASPCEETCDSPKVMSCLDMCVARCQCPRRTVLHEGRCIPRTRCPNTPTKAPLPDRSRVRPIVWFQHRLRVSANLSPLMKVLVYYVRADGETVADGLNIAVQQCTRNKVEIEFVDEERYPGETTTLRIRADPESLCSVGVVDKSVHILGGKNTLNLGQVMEEMSKYVLDDYSLVEGEYDYCENVQSVEDSVQDHVRPPKKRRQPRNRVVRRRQRRSIMWPGRFHSNYFDSMKAFRLNGLVVISSMNLNLRPCEEHWPIYRRPLAGVPGPGVIENSVMEEMNPMPINTEEETQRSTLDIRTYFPETWLWDLHLVGLSGETDVIEELPHTVTSWVGSGFCTNLHTGLGVSETTNIKGFQPFFVSLTLPYSLIRHEVLHLPVTVFNYLTDCLNVELTLDETPQIKIEGERVKQACVCGQETSTQYFRFSANILGDVNITIRAESVANNGICGNRIFATEQVGVRDAVVRTLLVEAEGEPQEYSRTSFVCPSEGNMHTEMIVLNMPENIVPDTAKASIKVIGDLMGPALDDIDSLLAMPTGCGEQNMLRFAPNIFVMQYLEAVDEVTPAIAATSKTYMEAGYQRELTYRHDDGSYSAFGKSDDSGSMFLTGFVLKSFAQATPLMYIDKENLEISVEWIVRQQLENGCFPKIGRVIHKDMKGGLAGDSQSPDTLTAYILIALLESRPYVNIPVSAIEDAMLCLRSYDSSDVYTRALKAYAYSLYNVSSFERNELMSVMEDMAQRNGDLKYWTSGHSLTESESFGFHGDNWAASIDIEITGYMLLAYTVPGAENAMDNGLGVVSWLSKQRSSGGGFSSTQDTVVALQSLSRYQAIAFSPDVSLNVMIQTMAGEMMHSFRVDRANKMIMQRAPVPMPIDLMMHVNGTGCAFVQSSVRYNMLEMPVEQPAFALSVHSRRVQSTDGCRRRELHVCTSYLNNDGASNMAVVSVRMVSGWIPDKETVKDLMNRVDIDLKRYEVEPNLVNFYFDEIATEEICLNFQVVQEVEVDDARPSYAEVYDYYEKEKRVSQDYEIRNICGTKEELPDLTPEEFEELAERDAMDPSLIEQRRVPPINLPGRGSLIDDLVRHVDDEIDEPVLEDIIEPEEILPLGVGDFSGMDRMQCPHCYVETPDNLEQLVCQATHAYKAFVRHGRYQAKLVKDLNEKLSERSIDDGFTQFEMGDMCSCSTVTDAAHNDKVLILQGSGYGYDADAKSLTLTSSSHVIPFPGSEDLPRNCQP